MMKRREFLQTGAGVTLSAAIPVTLAGDVVMLVRQVRDDAAAPHLLRGQFLVVDDRGTAYEGDGLYLYPAWGQPRAWEVSRVEDRIEFRMPGENRVSWSQSVAPVFAGRVLQVLDESRLAQLRQQSGLKSQTLELPVLPA